MSCADMALYGCRMRLRDVNLSVTMLDFNKTLALYDGKVQKYDSLKKKIEAYSNKYASDLGHIHWRIKLLVDQVDLADPYKHIHQLPSDWCNDLLFTLDSIFISIREVENAVRRYFKDFPVVAEEWRIALAKVEEDVGFVFGLNDDISNTLNEILRFRKVEHEIQTICCADRKYLEYAKLKEMIAFVDKANRHHLEFGAWIHDSRHYIDRLRSLISFVPANGLLVKTLHSIDALECALYVLKRDYYYGQEDEVDCLPHQPYEPYKLFHKFQYCFSEDFDNIVWERKGDAMGARVKWAFGMETVVLNLYANAAKYIPDDGRTYKVTTSYELCRDGLRLSVSSVGPYVPEDELVKVFDMGYRATSANLGSSSGSGRGLARVKSVCDRAGYEVWAESNRSQDLLRDWAVFSVTIMIPRACIVD